MPIAVKPIAQLRENIRDYVDSLVHPAARHEPLTAARHRAFIAPRLMGGLVGLTALPIHLALRGSPSTLEIVIYAWLAAPLATAWYLSRTGRYEQAYIISSCALAALVATIAMATGGIASFAAVWLVVLPLEAALSASRRVVVAASVIAVTAAGVLYVAGEPQFAAGEPVSATLMALGIFSAALYAAGLALGNASLARVSARLLTNEEDRYRLLARNITDVITRHRRNGTVRFASPAAESLFGVAARSLAGHGLFDRVHVADRPAYMSALAQAANEGEGASVEFRIRCDGPEGEAGKVTRFIWVEMRCRALEGADDNDQHEVVAVIRDVTDRKVQEQAVEAARAEAERANAAKSRFLATMSHELRTPLNAIIGFSEMLANEETMGLNKAKREDYAKLIGESGHHLLSVVNGILDMSRIETGNFEITPEPFAPAPVIGTCCDLMALRAREAGVELACRVPADLPDIVADKRAVKQILINLVSNAIKFTDRGGRVAVTGAIEGGQMVFTVEDTGVGIGEDDLRHVGDPFFQVRGSYDRPRDGTGLGVSIVKGLIALHGGELTVTSRVGSGTRFSVRLPVDCEKSRAGRATTSVTVERLPRPDIPVPDVRMKKRA
ncbi:MAG: two-component system, cell cycle sensor histidine kinase DivJ [Hyphomicrobiales bacterium]|nr:two-component system, cell cycle sensor histidine kinase DivJ [Hyphomicrobiales bacterium]